MYENSSGEVSEIIAGGTLNNNEHTTRVEVLGDRKNCYVPNLPQPVSGRPSVFQHGKTVLICGGIEYIKECYRLEQNKWIPYNSMTLSRNLATVIGMSYATYLVGGDEPL